MNRRTTCIPAVFAFLSAALAVPVWGQTTQSATRDRYSKYAMTHQGDAAAGKKLFLEPQKIACANCHTIDASASKAGPDLFAIGDKYGREDLIQQVLQPSATIAPGYNTTIIRTKSGDQFDGIVKETSADSISIMGGDGKLLKIKTDDIERQRTTDVSLMPEGLEGQMTQQQFADLIMYLTTLKAPQAAAQKFQGQPLEIPSLKIPVALKQFNSPANKFKKPVWFGNIPGVNDAYVVLEHETGTMWLFRKTATAETKTVFREVGKFVKGTNGLTGMVFHPQFKQNHKYYIVNHTTEGNGFQTQILQGTTRNDLITDSGEPLKETIIIHSITNDHPGGALDFGPDGYLYVGMGDSGPQTDPAGNAQNLSLLQGKILRIDVDHPEAGKGYSVPKDNPFVGKVGVCPEIWTYGHREVWRFAFDPVTGDLWEGDIGQDLYEEVNIIRKGENYGWNVFEGFERFSNKYRRDGETYVPPVFAYTRKYGQSVTGGYVYRGDPKSSFYGAYIFGDYQQKRLFAMTAKDRVLDKVRVLAQTAQSVVSIGRDAKGEIYYVGYEGNIYKLDLASSRFE